VIITGEGRAFSAGGDMNFLHDRLRTAPEENSRVMRDYYRRFLSVRKLNVPIIAAINGHAVGAGLCLALACDMRLAADTAKLGVNFSKVCVCVCVCHKACAHIYIYIYMRAFMFFFVCVCVCVL
jgi:enoyl-CoA hydratase